MTDEWHRIRTNSEWDRIDRRRLGDAWQYRHSYRISGYVADTVMTWIEKPGSYAIAAGPNVGPQNMNTPPEWNDGDPAWRDNPSWSL